MAFPTGVGDPLTLGGKGLGVEAGDVARDHHVEERRRLPLGIEHAETHQDGRAIAHPLLVRFGKANTEEAPRCPDLVVTAFHVAVLAGGAAVGLTIEEVGDAVLRGRPHLPLRVVKALVAGLAGFGLARLGDRERVAGVAVLAVHAVLVVLAGLGLAVLLSGETEGVATAAAALAGDKGVGLAVRERQRLDGEKALGVLAGEVLLGLFLVAGLAGGDRRQLGLVGVVHAGVGLAVAVGATHRLGHHPPVEVRDDHRRQLGVAGFTLRFDGSGGSGGNQHTYRDQTENDGCSTHCLLLRSNDRSPRCEECRLNCDVSLTQVNTAPCGRRTLGVVDFGSRSL